MEYKKYSWSDLSIEVVRSSFGSGASEHHAMLRLLDDSLPAASQFRNISNAIMRLRGLLPDTELIFIRYFTSDLANQSTFIPLSLGGAAISAIEQPPLVGKVGVWLYFVANGSLVTESGATVLMRPAYRHIFHAGLHAASKSAFEQTTCMLTDYDASLATHSCSLSSNCIRTWFYLRDIDRDYSEMVQARGEYFGSVGLTSDTHYIASTGIGGRAVDAKTLVTMDAYAIAGLHKEQVWYLHGSSHLNATHEYGVTFERGVAVQYGDRRHVIISGTASIDTHGEIVHVGDVLSQANRIYENITTLLSEGGAGLTDIAHLIIYHRDIADRIVIAEWVATHYPEIPSMIVYASVCRPGWLLEIECMAIVNLSDACFADF
jgi:enamine deaminase RidA (YjgF/YER057c/UK114 family)